MAFKAALLCASALFLQSISAQQCAQQCPPPSCRGGGSGAGVVSGASSNSGGAFVVQSAGPVAPRGLSAATDQLRLAGTLALDGSLPFLSAVGFDGQFPNSGSAAVSYGCGDGTIAITQELGNPSGNNQASKSGLSAAQLGSCGRCN